MRTRADVTWGLLVFAACAIGEPPEPLVAPQTAAVAPRTPRVAAPIAVAPVEVDATPVHDEELPPLLREIARGYKRWHLVDEVPNPAGVDCSVGYIGGPHISGSEPASAHVDKVFYLYSSDVAAYWLSVGVQPERVPMSDGLDPVLWGAGVRHVVVKESFTAVDGHDRRVDLDLDAARRGERSFRAGKPKGLFVMAKFAGAPEGTDAGWIYGTISPRGEVTSAGVIDKCVGCHGKQPDRLFGLPTRG